MGDEVWWSRLAQPALHTWAPDGQALRLVEQARPKADLDPKALAYYGLLVRHVPKQTDAAALCGASPGQHGDNGVSGLVQ